MYYVYLLKSEKTGKFYVGTTADLKRRFYEHNQGKNSSTKPERPWKLVYYESFLTEALATDRERKLKRYGRSLFEIKKRAGFS